MLKKFVLAVAALTLAAGAFAAEVGTFENPIVLAAAGPVSKDAAAVEVQSQDPDRHALWVTSGFFSHHLAHKFEPNGGYNESNTGLGLEYAFNQNWRAAIGQYKNSVYKTTRYAQVYWTPDVTTWRFEGGRVSMGVAVGLITGYPEMNNGGAFPAILPVISLEYKRVGVNLAYIPTLAGKVDGALALQFKFRFN